MPKTKPPLTPVFDALKAILEKHAAKLVRKVDSGDTLYLDTAQVAKNGKPHFFGAVQLRKDYVAFHFMPVYVKPALLAKMSPELKKRMQGKSCFNFKEVDRALFKELADLAKAGYASYKEQGLL